jgi:hypothetical protein
MTVTLASLSRQTGLAVLDHLEQSVSVPVVDRAARRGRTSCDASASTRGGGAASSPTDPRPTDR